MVRYLWLLLILSRLVPAAFGQDTYVPINTQKPGDEPPSAAEATAMMTVPPGFEVSLFAGEPDVRQPIAMNIDDRGRVWVAESYSYKEWEMKGEDRILIFEDADNDGVFDKRTVFYTGATHLSGFALGFGGVWICDSPNLTFIPDRDRDDVPDGPPEIVLDGFTTTASHNFFNGLKWGPDGWLYGRHGILAPSFVGKPGTPKNERTAIDCGVFRIHPVSHDFEVVARGTTNPWGMDWNEMGELFMSGNVNGHLWHVIPGAFYPRMFGSGFFPHVYDRIQSCAGHLHHVGDWRDTRKDHYGVPPSTDAVGGGHSHCGAMIYLGDNWPETYRGTIFMSNTHGRRINNETLVRDGSGYTSIHRPDFMKANHSWYKGVTQLYGPDGGVYASDWTDNGECHDNDGVHRTSGRIYKITHGTIEDFVPIDVAALDSVALVDLLNHENEWFARRARRLLQERFHAGADLDAARERLLAILDDASASAALRLKAVWSLHSSGGLGEERLTQLLSDENEHARSWAVRLIGEDGTPTDAQQKRIEDMAESDASPLVKLYIASTMPRFAEALQWRLAERLILNSGYEDDPNLFQMTWYGVEPLVGKDPGRGLALLESRQDSRMVRNVARRIASDFERNATLISRLVERIANASNEGRQEFAVAALTGMELAWHGLKGIRKPDHWDRIERMASEDVQAVAGKFDPVFESRTAMGLEDWMALLDNATRRRQAIRELAAFDDPSIPERLLKDYRRLGLEDRDAALATLSSRVLFAQYLMQAMRDGQVPPSEVSAYYARQIDRLGDAELSRNLRSVWGRLRASPEEKVALIQDWERTLSTEKLADANLENGKAVFDATCAACHSLYGEGGKLGPELNGSDRSNLYYVLENIIDPGAVLPRDYWMTVVELTNGRVATGSISARSTHSITLTGLSGEEVIAHADIQKMEQFEQSTMPEGLLQGLSETEVRDLVAYLQWK